MLGLRRSQTGHTIRHRHHLIERLRQDIRKSLWYAFDILANTETKLVHRSQLTAVTSTISVPLGFDNSEQILIGGPFTPDLAYEEYIGIVEREIFDKTNSSTIDAMNLSDNDLEEIHRRCWSLYLQLKKVPHDSRKHSGREFPETVSYSLWRVFNFLAEEDETGMPIRPLQLHQEEARHVLNEFVESTGQVTLSSQIDKQLNEFVQPMSFQEFEMLFQNTFAKNLGESSLKSATDSLIQKYIGDTLMEGMVSKRGRQVMSWNDRWMVLNSKELKYYTTCEKREMKGSITLDKSCAVEMMVDKSGTKPNRFVLKTQSKPYEMSTSDTKTRRDWMSALQKAIDKSEDKNFHFQRNELLLRQKQRYEKRRQKEEEERRKQEEKENIKRMQKNFNERLRLEELEREKLKKELEEAGLIRKNTSHEKRGQVQSPNGSDKENSGCNELVTGHNGDGDNAKSAFIHDHNYNTPDCTGGMPPTLPFRRREIGVQTDVNIGHLSNYSDSQLKDPNLLQRHFTMTSVLKDEPSCKFYTGLPLVVFNLLLQLISPAAETLKYWRSSDTTNNEQRQRHAGRILTVKEELVITLLRCRRGLDIQVLGNLFAVSSSTVSRIFTTWITFLCHHLQFLIQWPSKEQVRANLPKCFKYFPNTRVIIDCTEFFVQKPSLPSSQRVTWSNYKHQNTFKLLVGVSPSGTVIFLSKLFTGSISDKKIVEQSGFLDKLQYGDDVMADRGFLIRDLVTMKFATLNIPPFAMGKQLSSAAVTKTRRIANARIHVERAIGRLKSFKILQGVIPLNLRPILDQVVFVCAAMSNLDTELVN